MAPPIIKRFLIAFEQHKLTAFFVFALVFGISGIIALRPEQETRITYKADGELAFSTPPPIFTSTGEQVQQQGRQINIDILLAPRVLEQASQRLQLSGPELSNIVQDQLKIRFPEANEPQLIQLSYTSPQSQERAETVLNTFMEEMVEQSRLLNSFQLTNRVGALEERLGQVKLDLAAAEEAFYRFLSSSDGSSLLAVQDGSLFNGISNFQQQQRQLILALEEIDGQIESLISQLGLTPEQAYVTAALSADPIVANLRSQLVEIESQMTFAERDLRPTHPRVINLRKQKSVTEQLLEERVDEVFGQREQPLAIDTAAEIRQAMNLDPARQELANNLVALKTQREGIFRQLQSVIETENQLRQEYEQFPDRQLQQTRLIQEVDTQRALYQTILAALVDAQSAEAETVSSLAIAKEVETQPIVAGSDRPPAWIVLSAGAGLGLVASVGVVFLLATLDDRLHTAQELRESLLNQEVPILAQIPYVANFDLNGEETPMLLDFDSPYLGYYERARSNIRRLGENATKVILVTSVSRDEGKTVTAYNLAIASAFAGKRTLLIEADLRNASMASTLTISPDPNAANQPLQYYASRNDSIRLVPGIENLYLLPSPGPQRQVPAVIESNELQRLIEDARGRFDLVIIDTPSLSVCNDARLLERLSDGIVLVARPGVTRGSMLNEAIEQYVEEEAPLIGAVINDLNRIVPVSEPVSDRINVAVEEDELANSNTNR